MRRIASPDSGMDFLVDGLIRLYCRGSRAGEGIWRTIHRDQQVLRPAYPIYDSRRKRGPKHAEPQDDTATRSAAVSHSHCEQSRRLWQVADPDVAKAEGLAFIAVRLKLDGGAIVLLVERLADIEGLALELKMILDEDAVEEGGAEGRRFERTVVVEGGRGPDDVVDVPLTWLAHGIGERNALLVETAGHAVDVGFVVVGVENLKFVAGVAGSERGEKDSAVAARLAAAGDVLGDAPLDVELVVLERAFGLDVADAGRFADGEDAVVDVPARGAVILCGDPLVLILSVEENNGVGGRSGVGRTRCDDGGFRLPDLGVFRLGLVLGWSDEGKDGGGKNCKLERVFDGCLHDADQHTLARSAMTLSGAETRLTAN